MLEFRGMGTLMRGLVLYALFTAISIALISSLYGAFFLGDSDFTLSLSSFSWSLMYFKKKECFQASRSYFSNRLSLINASSGSMSNSSVGGPPGALSMLDLVRGIGLAGGLLLAASDMLNLNRSLYYDCGGLAFLTEPLVRFFTIDDVENCCDDV